MRLGRYIAKQYAGMLAATLGLIVVVLTLLSLIERTGSPTGQSDGLRYVSYQALAASCAYVPQFLPVAALLATVALGNLLARRGELLGAQALGIVPSQLARPCVLVAAAAALVGLLWAEAVVPTLMAHSASPAAPDDHTEQPWLRIGPWLAYLPKRDAPQKTFWEPTLFRLEDGLVVERIDADRLSWQQDGWSLHEATGHLSAAPRCWSEAHKTITLPARSDDLFDIAGTPRHLRTSVARKLVRRQQRGGLATTHHTLELFERHAQPLAAPIWVMLVAPWALKPDRRRTLAAALSWGCFCIGLLLVAVQGLRLMALAQVIPTWVGGGANIWAALVALTLQAVTTQTIFSGRTSSSN